MDLSVREWLVIIGALLAVAVLLDGYRRMSKDRRDTLRLSANKRREVEDELTNPELPGGPARVIAVREQPSLHVRRAQGEEKAAAAESQQRHSSKKSDEPDHDVLFQDPAEEYAPSPRRASTQETREEKSHYIDVDKAEVEQTPVVEKPSPSSKQAPTESPADFEELFVLNVVADDGKPYKGADLLQILLGCDLRYGRMKIFHRHERADGSGNEQFSVANLVEPGNFELDGIEEFSTPGVVFFMNLPGPDDSVKAFDAMLETARCLVKNLGGELRDQSHSVATKQTLEHYKQRIRDFERRQLTLM